MTEEDKSRCQNQSAGHIIVAATSGSAAFDTAFDLSHIHCGDKTLDGQILEFTFLVSLLHVFPPGMLIQRFCRLWRLID